MGILRSLGTAGAVPLLALALAACGGTVDATAPTEANGDQPALVQPDTASVLATHADQVVAMLEGGDTCGAAHEADALLGAVRTAVGDGTVDDRVGAQLVSIGERLQAQINCPDSGDDDDENEGKGKGKKKGKD